MSDVSSRMLRVLSWGVVVMLLISALLFLLLAAPQPAPATTLPPIPAVPVVALQRGDMTIPVHSQGQIRMAREYHLSSEVQGQVIWVGDSWMAGESVQAGELLLRIDPAPYELELRQRQAELDSRLLQQEEIRARATALQGQAADNDFARQIPQLRMADSQVAAARAATEFAQRQLDATHITSPISGQLASVALHPGQYINPHTILGVIHDTGWQEIHLPITDAEAHVLGVHEHLPTTPLQVVLTTASSDTIIAATVVRRRAVRGGFQQIILIARPHYAVGQPPLLPGTFVEAAIASPIQRDIAAVPRSALQPDERLFYVDQNHQLLSANADIIYRGKAFLYFRNPPATATLVVNSSRLSLIPGRHIVPITDSTNAAAPVAAAGGE